MTPNQDSLLDDIRAAFRQHNALRAANEKIGAWFSAALDDPNVCAEMKADLKAWFDAQDAT